ncbi:MAG: AI-2E family transporter [Ruminiclostridium sp.]|nr:AI-2E family transporter [Ruminiclostridium sp.]
MRFKLNPKYTQIAVYAVVVIVISGFLLMSAQAMPNLKDLADKFFKAIAPFVWGGAIAYLLNPAVEFFRFKVFKKYSEKADTVKKRNFIRNISILIVFILAVGLVTGLLFLIITQLSTSVKGFIDKFDDYFNNFMTWFNNIFEEQPKLAELLESPMIQIEQYITDSWADISKSLLDFGTAVGGNVLGLLLGLKDFIIGFIFAVYILISKDMLKSQVKRILFALLRNRTVQRVLHITGRTNEIFIRYVTSNLIDAFIIGCATFIGTSLMGAPYPLLMTVIIAVTNLIPFFGPFLGGIPCFFLILIVDPIKAVWFGIFIIVLQQVDGNVIKPVLFGETMGLPAIWVLVSIILFGGLFGIIGMLIGVPVFSVIYMLLKEFLDERLKRKKLPQEGALYNRDDIDKYVDGYVYTDEEREKDKKWLETLKEKKKERNFFRQSGGKNDNMAEKTGKRGKNKK